MHPADVAPGMLLAGRYRLEELVAEAPLGDQLARTWHAIDSVLSRAVRIVILDAQDPRTPDVLDAARHAATAADVRFLRVLDALTDDGLTYVVQESIIGNRLADLVSGGPLPAEPAGWLVREVAEAIASAHNQGLAHLRLDPGAVLVTQAGTVKIRGLATEAALRGPLIEPLYDPVRADAHGLGTLLYAALTARWPEGQWEDLPAAPRAGDGSLLSPRQCRAGVPKMLDAVCDRAVAEEPHHGPLLNTPDEVIAALTEAVGPTPSDGMRMAALAGDPERDLQATTAGGAADADATHTPSTAAAGSTATAASTATAGAEVATSKSSGAHAAPLGDVEAVAGTDTAEPTADGTGESGSNGRAATPAANGALTGGARGHSAHPPPAQGEDRSRSKRRWVGVLGLCVVLVLLVGVILFGVQAVRNDGGQPRAQPTNNPTPTPTGPVTGTVYPIRDGGDFDPPPDGNGEENSEDVANVYDGKPGTHWESQYYLGDPALGNIKDGVGIWVDLGQTRTVGSLVVDLIGSGTDLDVRAAPKDATSAPEDLGGWKNAGSTTDASGQTTVKLTRPVKTRFVLLWMTKLPPDTSGGGKYRGGIAEVVVRR